MSPVAGLEAAVKQLDFEAGFRVRAEMYRHVTAKAEESTRARAPWCEGAVPWEPGWTALKGFLLIKTLDEDGRTRGRIAQLKR